MVASELAPAWLTEPADVNTLPARVFSRTVRRGSDGEMTVGGVGVRELAERFGTPLYVVDEKDARERAVETLVAFRAAAARIGTDASVYYAGKSFLTATTARWMTDAGLRIDVCSGGELAVTLAAGVPAGRLGFHGNNKSLAEIDRAVGEGVGSIVLDSAQEIERVSEAATRHGRVQPVRLRVNSGIHAHTHEYLATAHDDQKFGIPLEDAERLVAEIRSHPGLAFLGLHCHIGSQIFDSAGFEESAARLLTVHARLLGSGDVPELNLGGGFGIAYTEADDPTPITELADRIATVVAAECENLGIPIPGLAFEPGRLISGPAGLTLYTVGTTKPVAVSSGDHSSTRLYVSVDGGMSDNARPALYGADYTVRLASRRSDAVPVLVRIAGKHCESGDIVVNADFLPEDVAPGDLLVVAATGAYCWSLSSNYNYSPRPAVVRVNDGSAHVIVRGQTEADLLAADCALELGAEAISGLRRDASPGGRPGHPDALERGA